MNLRIFFFKTKKFSDFLRWGSRLFHSIMVDGKKVFEKVLFCFKKGDIMYILSQV